MKAIYGGTDRGGRDSVISSTFRGKSLGGNASKFATITRSSVITKPKVSKIEHLGLSDPDGTNFEQERKFTKGQKHTEKVMNSVNSYKYLQN